MLEEGAYRRMLDLYYTSERPLPLDRKGLYRLVRARSTVERCAVDTVLGEYFQEGPTGWHQKRCDGEIEKAQERIKAARDNGQQGGRPRKPRDNPAGFTNGDAQKTQRVSTDNPAETQTKALHTPISILQSPKSNHPSDDLSGTPPDDAKRLNGKAKYVPVAESVISYLNQTAGRAFEFRNPAGKLTANADHVIARLQEGYTGEQLREVVLLKSEQWRGDEKMADYLRPETLFNRTKFQQYLGELSRG